MKRYQNGVRMSEDNSFHRLSLVWNGLCGCLYDIQCIEHPSIPSKEIAKLITQAMHQVQPYLIIRRDQLDE